MWLAGLIGRLGLSLEEALVRLMGKWETNKEIENENLPFYVIHYADYSPKRKITLNRNVGVATTEEDATAIFNEYDKMVPSGARTQPKLGNKNEIKIDKRITITPTRMQEC